MVCKWKKIEWSPLSRELYITEIVCRLQITADDEFRTPSAEPEASSGELMRK